MPYDEKMDDINLNLGKCVTKDAFEKKLDSICVKYDRDIF